MTNKQNLPPYIYIYYGDKNDKISFKKIQGLRIQGDRKFWPKIRSRYEVDKYALRNNAFNFLLKKITVRKVRIWEYIMPAVENYKQPKLREYSWKVIANLTFHS